MCIPSLRGGGHWQPYVSVALSIGFRANTIDAQTPIATLVEKVSSDQGLQDTSKDGRFGRESYDRQLIVLSICLLNEPSFELLFRLA